MAERNNSFDDLIRSSLGDATEEVPEYIWDSIQSRLPAKKQRKVIPLILKVLIPAAAAVVLAVLISPWRQAEEGVQVLADADIEEVADANAEVLADDDAEAETAVVAAAAKPAADEPAKPMEMPTAKPELGAEPVTRIMVEESDYELVADAGEMPAAEDDSVSEDENELATAETEGLAVAGTEDMTEGLATAGKEDDEWATAGVEEAEIVENQWEELLAEAEAEGYSPRFSATISGNAISNTNASSSGANSIPISFRPSKTTELRDMVSESSVSAYSIPLSAGVGVKIDFTPRWALGVGVNFTRLGRTFDGTYYKVVDEQLQSSVYSNIRNSQYYIGIPANAYFNILSGDFINFYAYAGGVVEKCVADRYLMTDHDDRIVHTEKVKGLQWSANAGIGAEFIIAGQFGIYIDPSLRYYFPASSQPKNIRTVQPLMFSIEVGLRVHL